MKKYCCPECSASFMVLQSSCPDCGAELAEGDWRVIEEELPPKPQNASCIHMVGDLGNLVFHRLATVHDVGSPLLSQIVAKARVAERAQFKIGWEGDTCFVIPIPGTKNATAVNGSIIERKTELRQGDCLSVCGRSSGKLGFAITIQYFA